MADIDLKTETPDTTLPTTGFLFGADSQAAASPSVFTVQSVATTLLGSTTLTGATVTTSQPVIDASQTWNDGGVTFTGLKFNATNTASASGSLLMDLQVGGASRFSFRKDGFALCTIVQATSNVITSGGNFWAQGSAAGLVLGLASDARVRRRGAANVCLGAADAAAPVAQTLSVQSVVAGTTDTAGANLTITGSQGTGTGAGGSIIFQVAPAGSSGTAQNALVDALTITSARDFQFRGAAASSLSFAGEAIYAMNTAANANKAMLSQYGIRAAADVPIGFSNSTGSIGTQDVFLYRDAANTLALRNGANAQAFRVYNTYTSATDFERGNIFWDSNVLKIGTEKGSAGGTARALEFQTDGTSRWSIGATTGHLLAAADNTYDIGASSATRPRSVYVGSSVVSNGHVQANSYVGVAGSGFFAFISSSRLYAPSDGVFRLSNSSNNDFNRLQFGGTTSSFPALKRNSTALETKLADDSAYAPHAMQYLDVTDGITAPASATGRARIYVDTADGDLKVIFADGTVKTIVTDT